MQLLFLKYSLTFVIVFHKFAFKVKILSMLLYIIILLYSPKDDDTIIKMYLVEILNCIIFACYLHSFFFVMIYMYIVQFNVVL